MAQIQVIGDAVVYDGDLLYPAVNVNYTVQDTYANYQKSLIDVAAGNINVIVPFTNVVNMEEQYLCVEADLTDATWNTVASHLLFGVTGLVKVKLLAEVVEEGDDTTGDTATICLGFKGATNALIAATKVDNLAAGELWYDATPTTTYDTTANTVLERIVNGVDIGYEIAGEAAKAGKIKFHCWYTPLNAGAVISVGTGAAMA